MYAQDIFSLNIVKNGYFSVFHFRKHGVQACTNQRFTFPVHISENFCLSSCALFSVRKRFTSMRILTKFHYKWDVVSLYMLCIRNNCKYQRHAWHVLQWTCSLRNNRLNYSVFIKRFQIFSFAYIWVQKGCYHTI